MPKFTELDRGAPKMSPRMLTNAIFRENREGILSGAQKGLPEGRPKITETAAEL